MERSKQTLGPAIEVKQFPFTRDNNYFRMKAHVATQYFMAIDILDLSFDQKRELFRYTWAHLERNEKTFLAAQDARDKRHLLYADATYHDVIHGVYQTPFNTASNIIAISQRGENDRLAALLTTESVTAMLIAAPYHDTGYVNGPEGESHARRRPIHVRESMREATESLDLITPPTFLDHSKVKAFVPFAIHRTNFPFDKDRKLEMMDMLKTMPKKDRPVAMLAAVVLQLADLGGQAACEDYFSRWLHLLRDEFNAEKENLGTEIVGTDNEMLGKYDWFLNNILDPTMGKIAYALFRTYQSSYRKNWLKPLQQPLLAS